MVLSRQQYKTVEWHLYNYDAEMVDIAAQEDAVLQSADYSNDLSGVKSTDVGDPTYTAAAELERLKERKTWCRVVEQTKERFEGTAQEALIEKKYLEKCGRWQIADELNIDIATYHRWCGEVVTYAAFKAAEQGVLKI